jgi:TolB-like protein
LQFIVEETLSGRSDRLKGYSIGTIVFGRDEAFDPQLDPIVRIEASRLRRTLQHYYLTAGRDDPVGITIPKGAYVPIFESIVRGEPGTAASLDGGAKADPRPGRLVSPGGWLRRRAAAVGLALAAVMVVSGATWLAGRWHAEERAWPSVGPAVLVMPFEETGGAEPSQVDFDSGLSRGLIAAMTRFAEISVYSSESNIISEETKRRMHALGVKYLVTGRVSVLAEEVRVTSSLVDVRTGQQLWSSSIDGSMANGDVISLQADIVDRMARGLAETYGAIFTAEMKEGLSQPAASPASQCVIRYDMFRRSPDVGALGNVSDCLERAARTFPEQAAVQAALASALLDRTRFAGRKMSPSERSDLLARSERLAKRAVELAPNSPRCYRALQDVYWMRGDFEQSFAAGEHALALNPNDSVSLVELGARYATRGLWSKGIPMIQAAYARNPSLPVASRLLLALHHYRRGEYREAIVDARLAESVAKPWTSVVLALSYARLGMQLEAEAAIDEILRANPSFAAEAVGMLEMHHFDPGVIQVIVEGLNDAGLDARGR